MASKQNVLRMSATIKERDLGKKRIFKRIEDSKRSAVYIGVLQGNPDAKLALIASTLEFGTVSAGASRNVVIPARPWMRGAVHKQQDAVRLLTRRLHRQILRGRLTKFEALSQIGGLMAAAMKREIIQLRDPANALSTLAAKFPKDNPLVDTGRLGNAINWEVRAK